MRSLCLLLVLLAVPGLHAQPDVIPSSADVRLVQGASADELIVQMKIHSTEGFGGILSAITLTIRYDSLSGLALGAGTSFCNAWSAFSPSPVVYDGGTAYRTYNGFGVNRLEDDPFDGGCGVTIMPEEWFTITTIPVAGDSCASFTLGNDAFTQQMNRSVYISMNGHNVTGQVVDATVNAGTCAADCLGVPGGPALPGTACDDGDPNTGGDAWNASCVCVGEDCVEPTIVSTSTNSPVCSTSGLDISVNAMGTAPLSYAWTGAGTFSPDATSAAVTVAGAETGQYQVSVTNACGNASASIAVQVEQAPAATISYTGSPYCSSGGTASVLLDGTAGGTFSSEPAGLSINGNNGVVSLGNSAAGTYTVSYSIPAGTTCGSFTATTVIVVTASPSAVITYEGSPYCSTGGPAQVTRTGSSGGSYSASPTGLSINANSGEVDPGNSAVGSYTVTYGIEAGGGCAAFSTIATVVINAAPSANIQYEDAPFCTTEDEALVTRTGNSGGTYSASPGGLSIDEATGALDPGLSDPGSYTVTYTIPASGGCAAFSTTASLDVNAAPSAAIAYDAPPYCNVAGTAPVTRTGTPGGQYSAVPGGLSLDAANGTIDLGLSDPGSYTVTYAIAEGGGCAAFSTTATIVVNSGPSATITYGGDPFCNTGGFASVTRIGSAGGSFSSSPEGLTINAGNGEIDLGSSEPGTYVVNYAIAAGGGCPAFNTTTAVTIVAGPSATIDYMGSPYCADAGTAPVVRTGTAGGTYSVMPSGLAVDPDNGAIDLAASALGTYTVTYTIAATDGCAGFATSTEVVLNTGSTWYADVDGDGAGDASDTLVACAQPPGYVAVAGDDCPTDPEKLAPGACGCGIPDTDTDGDGTADCIDGCPTDPNKIAPGACGCGIPDTDSDGDGIADCIDSCPDLAGVIGDACDDGDSTTVNDVITAECVCEGEISIGISDMAGTAGVGLSLYPNPNNSGTVFLDIDGLSPAGENVLVEVHDEAGRMVLRRSVAPLGRNAHVALDLSKGMGRGLYLVQVIVGGHHYLQRLVLQ